MEEEGSVGMSLTLDESCINLATFDFDGFMTDFEVWDDPDMLAIVTDSDADVKVEPEKEPQLVHNVPEKSVVKSVGKRGTRIGQKIEKATSTTTSKLKLTLQEGRFQVVAPNMSLKTTDMTLYAFPRFNKCDALMYFPSTMASFINSGDMTSLSELFGSYLHSTCPIKMTDTVTNTYPPSQFLDFIDTMSNICPDIIMCMHFTKVVESEIQSKLYFKFTDNVVLYAALNKAVANTPFAHFFPPARQERVRLLLLTNGKTEEEQNQYIELLDSDEDVQVYGSLQMTIQINDVTKRVNELSFVAQITSVEKR